MNRFWYILSAAALLALFASCAGQTENLLPIKPTAPEAPEAPREYVITDHKNRNRGLPIPDWVNLWLNSDLRGVETLSPYKERFVFVHRSEGNNFNALNFWKDGFSPELDFPRLAAARIEARFWASVPFPDIEYGALYEAMVRAASDTVWTGANIEDDFWIKKKYPTTETESENESWEFIILLTIEKNNFVSQLDEVFEKIDPNPAPSTQQIAAFDRVKDHFFEGF